jgi:transposase
MGKALSADLRERVLDAIERGLSRRVAAAQFGVSASSAIRWHGEYRDTGRTAPMQQGGTAAHGGLRPRRRSSVVW